MQFISSRRDVIRSINQRWLLSYWDRLRGERRMPVWQGLDAAELAPMTENLAFYDVTGNDGGVRCRIRYRGERINEALGNPGQRKFLDEVLPASYREAALSTYRQVLATQLPVYTIADLRDRNGRIVHYERLLLPFSRDGAVVDRILASLETVSPEGAFDNRDIMNCVPRPPAFALCTTIQY
jgi:hypothetical protein